MEVIFENRSWKWYQKRRKWSIYVLQIIKKHQQKTFIVEVPAYLAHCKLTISTYYLLIHLLAAALRTTSWLFQEVL